MIEPADAAIPFEAVKVSMRQSKDGVMITLAIHPTEANTDLLIHPVGSRYQVAVVLLDDENNPVMPKSRDVVKEAALLCKNVEFQSWLWRTGAILQSTEEDTVQYLHSYCGVTSRSQLAGNHEARRLYDAIRLRFNQSRSI